MKYASPRYKGGRKKRRQELTPTGASAPQELSRLGVPEEDTEALPFPELRRRNVILLDLLALHSALYDDSRRGEKNRERERRKGGTLGDRRRVREEVVVVVVVIEEEEEEEGAATRVLIFLEG